MLVQPFAALRPRAEHAGAVIAPPYDVVSVEEARQLAADRPSSFLHVSRPEIDLPVGTDPYSDAVYAHGAERLAQLERAGVLIRDPTPALYVYRMRAATHEQTGVACTASVRAYETSRIRKHELTRPDKENDRVRNILALNAQTGPVLCAYRADERIRTLLERAKASRPLFEADGPGRVTHTVWRVEEGPTTAALLERLNALEALYIADGHHRSAAAARVARERRGAAGDDTPKAYEYFLTVAFPHDALEILAYNRVVADLNGQSTERFLARLAAAFRIDAMPTAAAPETPATFALYVEGRWYRLALHEERMPAGDAVAQLDVSLLQEHVIAPLLGIEDPRTDPRVDFVGGVRGLGELERRVDSGRAAAAFALYPTGIEQLMAVADADRLMPPKSTWFEPKLADGLLSHVLD